MTTHRSHVRSLGRASGSNCESALMLYYAFENQTKFRLEFFDFRQILVSKGIRSNVALELRPECSRDSSLLPNLHTTYSRSAGTISFTHASSRPEAKHGRKTN